MYGNLQNIFIKMRANIHRKQIIYR